MNICTWLACFNHIWLHSGRDEERGRAMPIFLLSQKVIHQAIPMSLLRVTLSCGRALLTLLSYPLFNSLLSSSLPAPDWQTNNMWNIFAENILSSPTSYQKVWPWKYNIFHQFFSCKYRPIVRQSQDRIVNTLLSSQKEKRNWICWRLEE